MPPLPFMPMMPVPAIVAPPRFDIPSYADVVASGRLDRADRAPRETTATKVTLLAERLLDGASQLRRTLAMSSEESMWVGYLQPGAVESLADRLLIGSGFRTISRAEVRGLIANFDGVAANVELQWISSSSGFRQCRQGLAELLSALGEEPLPEVQPIVPATTQPQETQQPQSTQPDRPLEELPAPLPDSRLPDSRPAAPVYRGEA